MKKLLCISLAAALSLSLLAGCNNGATSSGGSGTPSGSGSGGELNGEITFWHSLLRAPVWRPSRRLPTSS